MPTAPDPSPAAYPPWTPDEAAPAGSRRPRPAQRSSAHHRTRRWQLVMPRGWHLHPAVRTSSQLTVGERAADRLRNGMGSWSFALLALLFLAGWMALNGRHGFDPHSFILLDLLLSCLAALQGAILLIAARRADQIASELALHDYQKVCAADVRPTDLLTQMAAARADLTRRDHALHGHVCSNPKSQEPPATPSTDGEQRSPGSSLPGGTP